MHKKNESLIDRLYREVMQSLQRMDGEDYEEYMEAVRYEVNARLQDLRDTDLIAKNISYK